MPSIKALLGLSMYHCDTAPWTSGQVSNPNALPPELPHNPWYPNVLNVDAGPGWQIIISVSAEMDNDLYDDILEEEGEEEDVDDEFDQDHGGDAEEAAEEEDEEDEESVSSRSKDGDSQDEEEVTSLRWRHNEHDGVSNYQPHDYLLNRLFRCKWKIIFRVTGLFEGIPNKPVDSPRKGPVTRKMFPFDDVIMFLQERHLWLIAIFSTCIQGWLISCRRGAVIWPFSIEISASDMIK